MSYWDTSTQVKLYAKESDSATFENQVLIGASKAVTSRIAIYEARATFQRKEAEGIIQPGAASNSTVILVELGADVERECGQVLTLCYKRSPPVPLSTIPLVGQTQLFRVGSTTIGKGLTVQQDTQTSYQDHGRNEGAFKP